MDKTHQLEYQVSTQLFILWEIKFGTPILCNTIKRVPYPRHLCASRAAYYFICLWIFDTYWYLDVYSRLHEVLVLHMITWRWSCRQCELHRLHDCKCVWARCIRVQLDEPSCTLLAQMNACCLGRPRATPMSLTCNYQVWEGPKPHPCRRLRNNLPA